ncbi:MAG TPA: CBS domain-containing protein [Alphaproteobacteria bacterium]
MLVREILKTKGTQVFTITRDQSIAELAKELVERRIGAAVVVDGEGALIGVISERDIVYGVADEGSACLDRKVEDLMTADVISCTPDTTIVDVMNQMTERRIRHLPVLEDGRLAGLVSIGDVVKQRIASAEREADQLREYISA